MELKSVRVKEFHAKTIESAMDIIGSSGLDNPADLTRYAMSPVVFEPDL